MLLAQKPGDLSKIAERAPRSGHVLLHQGTGHVRGNYNQATLLPLLIKYAHASGTF